MKGLADTHIAVVGLGLMGGALACAFVAIADATASADPAVWGMHAALSTARAKRKEMFP